MRYKKSFYFILFMAFLGSAATLWAFSEPTFEPPDGNVRPPINQTEIRQDKKNAAGVGGQLGVQDLFLGVGSPSEGDMKNIDELVGYNDLILRGAPGNANPIYIEGNPVVINNDPPNAKVGIGTFNPLQTLHIVSTGAHPVLIESSNHESMIEFNLPADPDSRWEVGSEGAGALEAYFKVESLGPPLTYPGSNDRFIIKHNTGNVGIGTNNPTSKLELSGLTDTALTVVDRTNSVTTILRSKNTSSAIGTANNYPLDIVTNSLPRITILTNGRVGIGTTTPAYMLVVNGSAAKPGGGSWTSSSDVRLKKNIETIHGALDKILSLRGVIFEWKDPASHGNLLGIQMGMIAQEVEKVFPQWIGEDVGGYKDLTFRGFEALTVEAIRELKREVDALRDQNNALEARIQALVEERNKGLQ